MANIVRGHGLRGDEPGRWPGLTVDEIATDLLPWRLRVIADCPSTRPPNSPKRVILLRRDCPPAATCHSTSLVVNPSTDGVTI